MLSVSAYRTRTVEREREAVTDVRLRPDTGRWQAGERGCLQLARRALGIRRAEDGRTGDDEPRAGRDYARDILVIDAAVDFDGRTAPCAVEQRAHVLKLRLAARDESLAAEPRVDRHDEDVVDVRSHFFDGPDRRRRVQDDARPYTSGLHRLDRAMQVWRDLDVGRDHRGTRFREGFDVTIGLGNHQVHVERHFDDALERL